MEKDGRRKIEGRRRGGGEDGREGRGKEREKE